MPKSSEPFLSKPDIALASVLANYVLYGSPVEPAFLSLGSSSLEGPITSLNWSMRLIDYFGLMVLPKPYFSPEGDLGGVKPFEVGEPGAFCIFVMNSGLG